MQAQAHPQMQAQAQPQVQDRSCLDHMTSLNCCCAQAQAQADAAADAGPGNLDHMTSLNCAVRRRSRRCNRRRSRSAAAAADAGAGPELLGSYDELELLRAQARHSHERRRRTGAAWII